MIDFIFPAAPRKGWPGRRIYLVRQMIIVVGQAGLLLLMISLIGVYVLSFGPAPR